jgi:hypothetical protein
MLLALAMHRSPLKSACPVGQLTIPRTRQLSRSVKCHFESGHPCFRNRSRGVPPRQKAHSIDRVAHGAIVLAYEDREIALKFDFCLLKRAKIGREKPAEGGFVTTQVQRWR